MSEHSTVNIHDIIFDGAIYPRSRPSTTIIEEYADALLAGNVFPPIILEAGSNRLLDGYHRWKAHQRLVDQPGLDGQGQQFAQIKAEYRTIPDGIEPRLYALHLSAENGLRPSAAEKEAAAKEQYSKHPGTAIETIVKYTHVSAPTVRKYIKPLTAKFEEDRRSIIMRLDQLGWTQDEIAETLQQMWPDAKGISRVSVTEFMSEIEKFRVSTKNDLEKGHAPDEIAKRYAIPEIIAWNIMLDGLDDAERMERLGIKTQPYDVWQFPKCHDLFGTDHPGRIPGEIVAHILYFFTNQGDMIIDPMTGSGTTPDVCLALGRRCYAYDIDQRHERKDVIAYNLATDGWPERVKKANLIFWDPPYFSKMDSDLIGAHGYIEGSISKFDRDSYLDFFSFSFTQLHKLVKPGTKLAFLMSDWDDDTGQREGIFLWTYANMLVASGWRLLRHIQVPLSTQQVHPDIVNKFRASRRLARLERYLLVAEA